MAAGQVAHGHADAQGGARGGVRVAGPERGGVAYRVKPGNQAPVQRQHPSDAALEDPALARRGYALLTGLLLLAVTGLLTLVLRDSAAFAPVLGVHLGAVVACFAIAPYTKFMHVVYRFLALVHDNAEPI